jgi:nucleotide-binding universal stress UspA family protein
MIRKKIKKILVPLDGSKNSMRGLDEGIYLARQCQATITGLYVIPIYPRNLADAIMPFQILLTKEAKKFMEVEVEEISRTGKFDIIVIGSRGQSGLKEAFLGSVANAIVHKSKVPVLVVK